MNGDIRGPLYTDGFHGKWAKGNGALKRVWVVFVFYYMVGSQPDPGALNTTKILRDPSGILVHCRGGLNGSVPPEGPVKWQPVMEGRMPWRSSPLTWRYARLLGHPPHVEGPGLLFAGIIISNLSKNALIWIEIICLFSVSTVFCPTRCAFCA